MSEHIKPEHSLALMTLSSDDPERTSAEQHAEGCPQCRALLREGDLMLRWIDGSAVTVTVDAALKNRIRELVHRPRREAPSILVRAMLAVGMIISALLAWFGGHAGELAPALGIKCLLYENAVAIAPFTLAAWLGTRRVIKPEPMIMAVVSMAGGVVGQLLLQSRCESGATSHLFAFHVGGVALAAGLGYLVSTRISRSRAA